MWRFSKLNFFFCAHDLLIICPKSSIDPPTSGGLPVWAVGLLVVGLFGQLSYYRASDRPAVAHSVVGAIFWLVELPLPLLAVGSWRLGSSVVDCFGRGRFFCVCSYSRGRVIMCASVWPDDHLPGAPRQVGVGLFLACALPGIVGVATAKLHLLLPLLPEVSYWADWVICSFSKRFTSEFRKGLV